MFAMLSTSSTAGESDAASAMYDGEMSGLYGEEDFLSIATGSRQLISKAPSTATVITAEDIRAIGATDLDEVLETVPGLHVLRTRKLYSPLYSFRGVVSEYNPQVLVLVNGIPITNLFQGDRNMVWGGMPVHGIARIEVVRGPGSALYGADAFSGVINIITKGRGDIGDGEVGARIGSFGSREVWWLGGGEWNGVDLAMSMEVYDTDGHDKIVPADTQSLLDGLFGTSASSAPGPVNTGRQGAEVRLDASKGDWRLRLGYQGRDHVESGAGVAPVLDPLGYGASDRFNADLTYHNTEFAKDWDVTAQLSYFDVTQEVPRSFLLFPEGAFGGFFPQGVIGTPQVSERHARLNASAFYTGFKGHRLRIGAGYDYADLYEASEYRNFDNGPGGTLIPLAGFDTTPFVQTGSRSNYYLFVQDEWSVATDWVLTAGLRYDDYSDFGDSLNPRLAVVWDARFDMTTKLLYGRAFRAPSFAELYTVNNPVQLGNPQLAPETIDTLELVWDYRPLSDWRMTASLFAYEMADIIRFVADSAPATTGRAQNTGEQSGYGYELEAEWTLSPTLQLRGNYAYQRSEDEQTDTDAGYAPHRQLYVRADWEMVPDWTLNTQLTWVGDRKRVSGDARPDIDDYTTVDMTLRYMGLGDHWEAALSVRNLFDEDIREPSIAPQIVDDLPMAGRSLYGEIRYRF